MFYKLNFFHIFWNRKVLCFRNKNIVFQTTLCNKCENHFCLVNYLTENFTSYTLHLANQSNKGKNQEDIFHNTVALIQIFVKVCNLVKNISRVRSCWDTRLRNSGRYIQTDSYEVTRHNVKSNTQNYFSSAKLDKDVDTVFQLHI